MEQEGRNMSECVVRMEMPKDCQYCPMAHWGLRNILSGCDAVPGKRYLQGKDDEFWKDGRPSWCPIICSLTEGHGRLVDEKSVRLAIDDIVLEIANRTGRVGMTKDETMEYINSLCTIVPAERSET